jgi:hypothetical protein
LRLFDLTWMVGVAVGTFRKLATAWRCSRGVGTAQGRSGKLKEYP